jgi:photosystem II stability/assembly factor-like uncharacterized protein
MQSLIFFNKEGDNLNFTYDQEEELWQGDLIFHQNSDDTFKTVGLYVFEKIPSFEYERPGDMQLEKFQLFNESRFNISGSSYFTQSIKRIEVSNNDPTYFSKWVYGVDFERLYPVGTDIKFDYPFLEFRNLGKSYTVIKSKKDAILIMSDLDNRTFNEQYGASLEQSSTYRFYVAGVTFSYSISGVNSIGIYDYINPDYTDKLSSWSEPGFYDKLFEGRVLNFINTEKNDGIYNVKNSALVDKVYSRFTYDARFVTHSINVMLDVLIKTELPSIYSGPLSLTGSRVIFGNPVPLMLKPGMSFFIPASQYNSEILKVAPISKYFSQKTTTFYATHSQVLYENRIYECIKSYVWTATSSILPTFDEYWSSPTYLPITSLVQGEDFNFTDILIEQKNRFTYSQTFTQSVEATLGSSVQKYSPNLSAFDIDYYVKDKTLHLDLVYPADYADIKIMTSIGSDPYVDVTSKQKVYQRVIEIEETLKPEINRNSCENFKYNIVFTDIDDYGIRIVINGQVYYESVEFIYDGLDVQMERTIDKTLRNWITKWYVQLAITGVIAKLKFTGKSYSFYVNTIQLTTEYPNVPLDFSVQVGTTANFYLQRAQVIFNKVGSSISVYVNGREYQQKVSYVGSFADLEETLKEWVENYSPILEGYGIYVDSLLSMLRFNVKEIDTRFEIRVKSGASTLPGIIDYQINDFFVGSFGSLISSNSIVLTKATYSFEDEKFATGQIVTINNSNRVWNNQEYNIEYVGPKNLNLSYQGPFWPSLDPLCYNSPFISLALSTGFGATGCTLPEPVNIGGEFAYDFSSAFFIYANRANSYVLNTDFPTTDTKKFIDIIYLSLVSKIFILGDKMTIIDSNTTRIVSEVELTGITSSISMHFNEYNNYLYCLSEDKMFMVDPTYPRLDYIIDLGLRPVHCGVNPDNGDVYVSYGTKDMSIWYYDNYTSTPSLTFSNTETPPKSFYRFAYNKSEEDMYVTSDDVLYRIMGSNRTIRNSYNISGLKTDIYYEPQNSSLYVFDSSRLNNVNGGEVTPLELDLQLTDWLPQPSGTTSNLNNIAFFDKDKGIIVGDKGTILITENAGENWNSVSSTTTQDLNSLSIVSQTPGWAVAAGNGGKVIFTNDYGKTWQQLRDTAPTTNINSVYFISTLKGYFVGNVGQIGVYINTGAPLWTVKNLGGANTLRSVWANSSATKIVAVGDGDVIGVYNDVNLSTPPTLQKRRTQLNSIFVTATASIAVGEDSVMLRSSDRSNWFVRDPSIYPRNFRNIYFSDNNNGWIVGSSNLIRRTVNAGLTWSTVSSGLPTTTSVTFSSVHFINNSYGIIGGEGGNILWSENGGASWNRHVQSGGANWSANRINAVRVIELQSGNRPSRIAVGNSGTVLRSDFLDYRKISTVGTIVNSGTFSTDGVYSNLVQDSTSGNGTGAVFNVTITNNVATSVTVVSGGSGYATGNTITIGGLQLGEVTSDIFMSFSVSSTISLFSTITVSPNVNINCVIFVSTSGGIMVGDSGSRWVTGDGGKTWSNQGMTVTSNLISICNFGNLIWIGTSTGQILYSASYAAVFSIISTIPDSVSINSISFVDATNGSLVDSFGRIWNSTNGGVSWTQVTFNYNSVYFVDDNYGWIAGNNGLVLRTTNGGAKWDYVFTGATSSLTSVYFIDQSLGYISGPNRLLRKNTQGGISMQWGNQDSGNSQLNDFAFTDSLTGYVVGDNGELHKVEKDPPAVRNLVFNKTKELMYLSTPDGITTFTLDGQKLNKGITNEFGPLVVNDLDGDVYLASQTNQKLFVFDSEKYYFKHQVSFNEGRVRKLIYNPDRQSVFGIVPNTFVEQQSIFELSVIVGSEVTIEKPNFYLVEENNYGTLDRNYEQRPDLWLKTREYIRRPRANYNNEPSVDFIWTWEDDQTPEIFLYDFSGEQLHTGKPLSYSGPKPLPLVALSRKANKKLDRVGLSEFQQTIFDELVMTLDKIDDSEDLSFKPTPMEVFIGINSPNEGVISSILNLYKRENIAFTISATSVNNDVLQFTFGYTEVDGFYGMIIFSVNSISNFRIDSNGVPRGLKSGQLLKITITDNQNRRNKYISLNNGITVRILRVFTKYIIVKFIDTIFTEEFSQIDDYPLVGNITYLTVNFEVIDKLIGKFNLISQTEIEDIRYKIELSNTGHLVDPYDTFIFKEYDINEQGIDWNFLNKKRKELLMVRDQIFPYIGSYKSIINAINYFGYNDLELYEYYRNIDPESDNFYKLFKVEIPDIFDNSVPGWKENDFIKHTLPNPSYTETNLFNLTYKITDKEGNNVLQYSLSEVIMKLQALKIWLEKKIVPISHRILDITGRADFVGVNTISHKSYDVKIINHRTNFTPIDFSLDEAYLMPINSGSTVYTCHVSFFLGAVPTQSVAPDYFTLRVRTYKTYKEWNPFEIYQKGDRVIYYGIIYESVIDNNKIKDPRKYNNVGNWTSTFNYTLGEYALYNKEIYQYIGTQSSFDTFGSQSNYEATSFATQSIIKIEATDDSDVLFTKWVYGENFQSKFPMGSTIRFDYGLLEFIDTTKYYEVVSTKKDAVMIISGLTNSTYNDRYGDTPTFQFNSNGETYSYSVSGFNAKGRYEYVNPYMDVTMNGSTASWFLMTEWKRVDLVPVQNLVEYRMTATFSISDMRQSMVNIPNEAPYQIKAGDPYNFTIDSNIDPFISIEVTSDNGYGQIFTQKKNYEIRGLNDLFQPVKYIDQIGPFVPITQLNLSL